MYFTCALLYFKALETSSSCNVFLSFNSKSPLHPSPLYLQHHIINESRQDSKYFDKIHRFLDFRIHPADMLFPI